MHVHACLALIICQICKASCSLAWEAKHLFHSGFCPLGQPVRKGVRMDINAHGKTCLSYKLKESRFH